MPPFGLLILFENAKRFALSAVCAAVFGVLLYHSVMWGVGSEEVASTKYVHVGTLVLAVLASIAAMFDLAMSTAKHHGPWHRAETFVVLVLVLSGVGPLPVLLRHLGVSERWLHTAMFLVGLPTAVAVISGFSALNRRAGWKPLTDATLEKSHE